MNLWTRRIIWLATLPFRIVLAMLGFEDGRPPSDRPWPRSSPSPRMNEAFQLMGCLLIVPSAPVAALLGGIVVLLGSGTFLFASVAIGAVAGWISGSFAAWGSWEFAVEVPRLRSRADAVGLSCGFIAAVVVPVIVTVGLAAASLSAGGRG